jgi:hypothetical protein
MFGIEFHCAELCAHQLRGAPFVAFFSDPVERDECYKTRFTWLALAILQNGTNVTRRFVCG